MRTLRLLFNTFNFDESLARTELLCLRDTTATLAAVALAEIGAEMLEDGVYHTDMPDGLRKAQDDLLRHLFERGHLTRDQVNFSYVEPMCLEHGVVHVNACEPGRGSLWLEVDPVSGAVQRL
jgi:hypothetical protein